MLVLSNFNFEELALELKDYKLPKFKIKSIEKWLLNGYHFDEMTDINKDVRQKLAENYIDQPIEIMQTFSSEDGTQKYLFKLYDNNLIEGVLMKYSYGNTLCISSQVGCRMGCVFCASGMDGLLRNLEPSEMLGQVTAVNRAIGGGVSNRQITNIVMMGSGEPLDNYENVVSFLNLVQSEQSLGVSKRNISLSTSGLVPMIMRMADENLGVTLTISLHNPFDNERCEIMPVSKAYSVEELIKSARYYFKKTGRRVVFEYTLIKGINTTDKYADQLAKIISGFPAHINCIIYNEVKGKDLQSITRKEGYKFVGELEKRGLSATLRRQMGVDIEGACGQLRRRYLQDEEI